MTTETKKPTPAEKDLIDRIADALPENVRADYFREMRHLRNLSENDEMLRILRAMLFLALLAERVPSLIATERERFQRICKELVETAANLLATEDGYYKELDRRLTQLPADIAWGISPAAIVGQINDVLKRQFDLTTIPATAKELAGNAKTIQAATKDLVQSFEKMCGSWNSVEARAKRAIEEIGAKATSALAAAEEGAKRLVKSYERSHGWVVTLWAALFLMAGIFLGWAIFSPSEPKAARVTTKPAIHATQSAPASATRRK
jgi:hypothetical protein